MISVSAGADPGRHDAAGGRIGTVTGPDGTFMVDAQYAKFPEGCCRRVRGPAPTVLSDWLIRK